MDRGFTTRLADYAATPKYIALPWAVRVETVSSLFNIMGCRLGGAHHRGAEIADHALGRFGGRAEATLIGRGRNADALHAAMINCLSRSIHSFDDTHAQAAVHPTGPVAAAALALAELAPVSGQARVAAFASGVELEGRLCKALTVAPVKRPPAKASMAWSGNGITGGTGAAVAAASLLGLDMPATRNAIGIALSRAAGFRAMHGSLCTPLMPTQAVQSGLRGMMRRWK